MAGAGRLPDAGPANNQARSKPLFAKEKMIAQVRSAIRLRDRGNGKRPYRLAGEQNQKERTFDVLPKPGQVNLLSTAVGLLRVSMSNRASR
jgi:hypothetical protein